MISYNFIQINGVGYNINNLDSLPFEGEQWQMSIKLFLKEWFNENDFIEVKTSGSTGTPKKIQLKKLHMVNSACNTIEFFNINAHDNLLLCLPVSFIAGKMMLLRAMVARCNIIAVPPSARPFEGLDIPISFAALSPLQLSQSLDDIKKLSIKTIIVGGAPVSLQLEESIQQLHTNVYETFGMTETCSHVALRCLSGSIKREYFTALSSIHFAVDKRNCLVIDAPMVCSQTIVTNDIVQLLDSNSFKWHGRADNVVNSGGIKIFPEQIERKIASIPENRRFFVKSQLDDMLGQKLILVIEGDEFDTYTKELLSAQLRKNLKKHEIPKTIYFVSKFMVSGSGKILSYLPITWGQNSP